MTGYSQQMPPSHWLMSAILASDWLLDLTHPAYTTDIKMGRAGKRERGKNWEDFGAKTERTSCSTRQLPHPGQGCVLDWTICETEDWGTLNCAGWCNNPLLCCLLRGRSHRDPAGGERPPASLTTYFATRGDQSEASIDGNWPIRRQRVTRPSILMYFDTGGDIIPETSSQYFADHWKSDQFCTELGNNKGYNSTTASSCTNEKARKN